ncbi:hypothetical protein KP509_30G057800 [Ceratopteris richardii]|uniref:Uncharacterized protein n=1 Tax=Ceratopteris richardii TaxID=49495 RepID=A0A8T2R526_CERRI|nr:hypothetical protein KP509_30G057800 [Ceratopteris richardii]
MFLRMRRLPTDNMASYWLIARAFKIATVLTVLATVVLFVYKFIAFEDALRSASVTHYNPCTIRKLGDPSPIADRLPETLEVSRRNNDAGRKPYAAKGFFDIDDDELDYIDISSLTTTKEFVSEQIVQDPLYMP